MIDRNESLRDQIATIVQAGYSERKTSVETADEIRSKISLLSIVTRLERENDELRKDKARMREALDCIVALGARMPEDAEEVCIAKAALSPAIPDSKP